MPKTLLWCAACVILAAPQGQTARADSPAENRVLLPAVDASQLATRHKGRVLLTELNCAACHPTKSSVATSSKKAPRLSDVGRRINPFYLEAFVRSPHQTKPGTTMPDLMVQLDSEKRTASAKALTHFLLSLSRARPFQLVPIDSVAAERGEQLFHSVGCVACHSPRDASGKELLPKTSVPLGALEKKTNMPSLAEFLRSPHRIRPSGRMPNLQLSSREAMRVASYLLRKTRVPGHLHYTLIRGRVWEGLDVNVEKERAGQVDDFDLKKIKQLPKNSALIYDGFLNVDQAGTYEFFLEFNGGELQVNDQQVATMTPSNRRGVKRIQKSAPLRKGWNQIQLTYIHAGKEPSLRFEFAGPGIKRKPVPAARLSVSKTPIKLLKPYPIDEELVKSGRRLFGSLGCANCHDDVKVDSATNHRPLSQLATTRGCLSKEEGKAPRFLLDDKQTGQLREALLDLEDHKPGEREHLRQTLVSLNCIACHERAGLGGVSPERDPYFSGTKKELGNQGRIPPPLTLVGAKLNKDWLRQVVLQGRQQRDYLETTMPVFGEDNVGHLVDLFEKIDTLEEKVTFAEIKDRKAYKAVGHELMGTKGFSCIACHDFNGQKAGGPGAMEIIHSTQRLKKDWFYLFMLNPAKFRPRIVMPAAWPNGHVFKEHLLDGDAKKQIESLWVYLEDGTRAKNPIGLSRKSPELRVTDEAVICRGRGTSAGYRGIAVGYPERLSLAFDSQELNLRLLWKGEFANVDNGRFSPRGRDRIDFPPGIPFHRLQSMEDNWPYKRKTDYEFPQDHGYQFRGYYLDPLKRPTFMYHYGDIRVEEFFEDRLDQKREAYFRRTFTFEAPAAQEQFYFRAASGKSISRQSDTTFVVDRLKVTLQTDHRGVIREGEPQELLIPISLPKGKSQLTLDYKW